MNIQQVYGQAEDKMKSAVKALHKVEYYGSHVPLNQVATISVPEPRLIVVQPWDAKLIPEIEKAVRTGDLGLNPANDGRIVRIPIPQLNEERRKQLVKVVKRMAEECRVSVRNSRRDAMESLKHLEKEKEITEDDHRKAQAHIQKQHDDYIKQIDHILEQKEAEIMEV